MEFENIIRIRTSVRKFCDQNLEQAKLDKILEAGRLAPTAKNNQPFRIYVVNSEDGKQLLLPAIKDVIKQVDINNKKIIVHLLEGLV